MKVGQLVRLNDTGIYYLWGYGKGLSHMKTLVMKITAVDSVGDIYVDNEDINQYHLKKEMLDLVKKS